jgi:glycine cleavage system pyridoxal-binding protein P
MRSPTYSLTRVPGHGHFKYDLPNLTGRNLLERQSFSEDYVKFSVFYPSCMTGLLKAIVNVSTLLLATDLVVQKEKMFTEIAVS